MVTKEITRCDFCGKDIDGAPYARVKIIKPAANWDMCADCASKRGLYVGATDKEQPQPSNMATNSQNPADFMGKLLR